MFFVGGGDQQVGRAFLPVPREFRVAQGRALRFVEATPTERR
jgi:hypothetical protein